MVASRDSLADGDALSTRADGIGGVLDVGAVDVKRLAILARKHGRADPEPAVGAVRGGLGGHAAAVQLPELRLREPVFPARRLDRRGVRRARTWNGHLGVAVVRLAGCPHARWA